MEFNFRYEIYSDDPIVYEYNKFFSSIYSKKLQETVYELVKIEDIGIGKEEFYKRYKVRSVEEFQTLLTPSNLYIYKQGWFYNMQPRFIITPERIDFYKVFFRYKLRHLQKDDVYPFLDYQFNKYFKGSVQLDVIINLIADVIREGNKCKFDGFWLSYDCLYEVKKWVNYNDENEVLKRHNFKISPDLNKKSPNNTYSVGTSGGGESESKVESEEESEDTSNKSVSIKINDQDLRKELVDTLKSYIDEKDEATKLEKLLDGKLKPSFVSINRSAIFIISLFLELYESQKISVWNDEKLIIWFCENLMYWNDTKKQYAPMNAEYVRSCISLYRKKRMKNKPIK